MKGNVKKRKQIVLKKTPKIKIAFAIIGIAIGLLLSSVFVFEKINNDKKVVSQINAQNCGQGTFTWHNCTACYQVGGSCGGGLTYTCGSICLSPSCGAKACGCNGVCNCTCPAGYQASNNSCSTTTCNGSHSCGQACSFSCYRQRYAVNLTANGGTGTNCKSYTTSDGPCGSTSNTAFGCTRTGYTLSSYSQTGCGGTWDSSTGVCSSVTGTLNVTANWTANTYQVSVNANGGSCSPGTHSVNYGSASSSQSCSRTGYTFSGFSQSGCGGSFNATTGVCSSVTQAMSMTASWTINSYQVTVDANGGSCSPGTHSVSYGYASSSQSCSRTGYTFSGFTQSGCGGSFNATTGVCSSVTIDMSMTASWTSSTVRVSFTENPPNGAASESFSPTYRDVTPGSSCEGPSFSTNTGYVFVNFTITSGSCAGTFTASTGDCSVVNEAMTVQANWNIRVTYWESPDAGGSLSPTYRDVGYGTSATGPTATPATGWSLNNFYISSGSCAGTFTASTGTCSNVQVPITIVATWYNSPPSFNVTPYETVASYATSPTPVGNSLSFRARATDANASYYLIICATNSVTPGTGGAAPTCGSTKYCNSAATTSNSYASCSYTTNTGNAWSNPWYAFVCDNNTSQSNCSSANQGSGNSGSPFYVNHPPTFSSSSVSAAVNPGGTITWTTTSSDPDGNMVKLLVCKTAAMSSGSCTGGAWCTSSLSASNPTCDYVTSVPYEDGSYNAYPYIVDQFNLAASGSTQGSNRAFTVNNVAPSVSATLNSGAAISLTESTTTNVEIVADITDDNGCLDQVGTGDEISSVSGYLYRSGVSYAGCDTSKEEDANYCYPEIKCKSSVCSNGLTNYSCTAEVQYYADPTTANTLFPTENWLSTIKATDDDSAVGTGDSTGVELNTLLGGSTAESLLDFGNIVVGGSNDPLNKTLTHNPTGNVGIDITVKANTASMCTDYSTCTGGTPIPISHLRYSLAASTAYSAGLVLTTTAVEREINIPKQTSSTAPTKQTWWGIYIPTATLPGIYNGLNVIEYSLGETSDW